MWHDELFPFFNDLATDHQVVFYDQRGNGKSLMGEITADNFTMDWLVSDLEELRTAWGFDRINIIGHSWGGLVAMCYAAQYPGRVQRLVLVDAAPVNTELMVQSYDVLTARFTERDRNRLEEIYSSAGFRAGDPALFNEAMRLSEGATFHVDEAREEYFRIVAFDEVTARNMVLISGPAQAMKMNIAIEHELGRIDCPTLVIHGARDFIVRDAPNLVCKLITDARLVVIPASGHYPFIEQPDAFTTALRAFITETSPSG
jgi:proline iminopeptidase